VASEIEGRELDIAYRELFRGGVEGRLAGGLLVIGVCSELCDAYRTATRSFLSMCKRLWFVSWCLLRLPKNHTWSFRHCHCSLVSNTRRFWKE
jgi:hypothetical protein